MWTRQIVFSRPLRHVHFSEDGQARPQCDTQERSSAAAASTISKPSDQPSTTDIHAHSSKEDIRDSANKVCGQIMAELTTIKSRQNEWLHGLQQVSIEIAIRAAEQLLSRRIENGEQDLQSLVHEAVSYFDGTATLTVYLSPNDLQSIEQAKANWPADDNIHFVVDDQLQRGQCRVDSADFDLLFDWQARLEDMRITLIQRLNDARIES